MKNIKKIVGINLVILLVYMLIFGVALKGAKGYDGLGLIVMVAFTIGVQFIANLIISIVFFVKKDNDLGRSFLLSAFAILLIGFSTCFGTGALVDAL